MKGIERVRRARSQLVSQSPFFGVLALHLDLQESKDFDTMATDGVSLYVNPSFADTLNDAELRGVLAHEVMHCAAGHMARQGTRDHDTWNEAADFAINQELVSMGFTLPSCALIDRKYDGLNAESVYTTLARQSKPQPQQGQGKPGQGKPGQGKPSTDPGGCGSIIKPSNGTQEAVAQDWKCKTLVTASVLAKQAGSLPGSIQRLVNELRAPSVSWRDVLARFVTDSTTRDYSWSRPNRRLIGSGLYLPSLVSTGRNHVLIAVDVSGSIDDVALQAFGGELQGALDQGAADRFTVLYCDTRIQSVQEYEKGDTIKLATCGGGGTSFAPVMQWIDDNMPDASCLLYFTDLECSDYGQEPAFPVLWVQWSDGAYSVPFGEIVKLDAHV